MRDHTVHSSAEALVEPHRFKKATIQARAAAYDTYDLDELEEMEMPSHSISTFFANNRRRDARIFSR
ncbi:hypothetical protein [Shinella zoogloeoides]|uniref:hypothetical protein n=1 Tax=Shinella zoogloeoides TaxID=352475 RepID=UPI00273E2653|nr:hypothetical protein [Shinella zoogloeoides]WLR90968.1 hypothetical protein Q9316_00020 [Shinella zoogloeoides]